MADVKISQLPASTTPLAGTELVPIVQSGVTKQATVNQFGAGVGYLPAGTGAVATTVQTKLRESVSVKDFGAVGDGVTDDTAAIQAAIAAANVAANADGKNRRVIIPTGFYQISGQILVPYGVSLAGEGERSTVLRVASTFAALTTTGAVRIGDGVTSCFGVTVEDLMIECSSIANSIGVYSSDIQSGGLRHVTVNNFGDYGVRFNGVGGTFGSVNGFGLEHVQCFKRNAGGTGGIGISLENGTFPAFLYLCQVFGNPSNPLGTGYNVSNFPIIATSCNTDGAGTNSIVLGTGVPNAVISGFTSNGWTNATNITTTGRVVIQSLYRASGTNSIIDAGNGGSVAKTLTDAVIPVYVRGATTPTYLENTTHYGQTNIGGGVGTTLNLDKLSAINTKRMQLFVGDGTGGTTADDNYIASLNTVLHFWAGASGNTEVAKLLGSGELQMALKQFYPATPAGAYQTTSGMLAGSGVPSNADGNNGDFYFRGDTPGTVNQRIYVKSAGAWVGIV